MSNITVGGGGSGGGVFGPIVPAPINQSSPGVQYEVAFDASGNLYIAWATNTWAKYTNVAPFGPQGYFLELFALSDMRNLLKL